MSALEEHLASERLAQKPPPRADSAPDMETLLTIMVREQASDLIVKTGSCAIIKNGFFSLPLPAHLYIKLYVLTTSRLSVLCTSGNDFSKSLCIPINASASKPSKVFAVMVLS